MHGPKLCKILGGWRGSPHRGEGFLQDMWGILYQGKIEPLNFLVG